MKNESGKSIVILVILTILIMIIVGIIINYTMNMINETQIEDMKTNMLLMQAEAQKGLEEVCFRTVNTDETKEEDKTKINEIKIEYLEGIILSNAPIEVQEAAKSVPEIELNDNCYYLDKETLNKMGIIEINEEQDGFFIVKYDFENANVEIINTKGTDGKYTLTQIVQEIEGMEENQKIEEIKEKEEVQS